MDYLIIGLFVLQIAALIGIARVILRIKRGPVDNLIGHTQSLAEHGKSMATAGKSVFEANRERVMAIAADASGLISAVRGGRNANALASEPITYAKLRELLTTIGKIRTGLGVAGALRRGGIKAAIAHGRPKPTKSGAPRRSLVDRLGLLPPAARKLAPILRVARTAFGVHRQLRQRGMM